MERVYVGNLPPDIRIKDIDDFFRPFGKLVAIDVNNRSNPAFAFVQFDSPRNAISAVRNRHGYDYEGYTLQVKLVENAVNAPFEVRNQRQQTPPPPPPVFNDFNNQMGGGYGNNNFGRNSGGNFGNSGSNFGGNRNSGGNFGNTNGVGNFGGNTNFGNNNLGNNFPNDNFNNSSSFQRNMPSQNMVQYPNTNVRSIMPAQNNMIEYPRNSAWGSGGGNSNRGGGGSNRGSGGMGNNYGNMGDEYSFNPNNNCYADNDFEDRYTQGLSGSGRKWFNRYISKGFAPQIAREKALEHRTVPYLRDGPKRDQIPNNAVANLPLPALESFGNKIISLFSGNTRGGGGVNFGGNWGNNNLQGGFSNDFNMGGPSSSNYRSGNRINEIRSLVPARAGPARPRGGRPDVAKGTESGILEKMLSEIPRGQRKLVAKEIYNKSIAFLKGPIKAANDRVKKKYHKQIVQEYETKYNTKNLSAININPDKSGESIDELKRKYHEKKNILNQQARRLPEYPGGKLSETAKTKIKLLLENGFVESGARTLSKLPMPTIKQFIILKQTYEAAVKATPKGVKPSDVVKSKSDKEAAHLNNLKLLRKYEAEKPRKASNGLIMVCLKKIRQYEKEMDLKPITTKFDKIKKPKTTAKKPVAKTVDTKDKQKQIVTTVDIVVEDNAENKKEAELENQDSNETENKTLEDQENMETTEEQNDVIENKTDADDDVKLIEDDDVELVEDKEDNKNNQEEQNENEK